MDDFSNTAGFSHFLLSPRWQTLPLPYSPGQKRARAPSLEKGNFLLCAIVCLKASCVSGRADYSRKSPFGHNSAHVTNERKFYFKKSNQSIKILPAAKRGMMENSWGWMSSCCCMESFLKRSTLLRAPHSREPLGDGFLSMRPRLRLIMAFFYKCANREYQTQVCIPTWGCKSTNPASNCLIAFPASPPLVSANSARNSAHSL